MNKYIEHLENQRHEYSDRDLYLRKRAEYEYYRNRKYTLYGVILGVVGIATLLTKELFLNFIDTKYSILFIAIGAISFASGIGLLLFKYLQNGSFGRLTSSRYTENNIQSEIQDLRIEILKLRKKGNSTNDSESISKTIKNAIDNTLTEDFIKSKIEDIYSEKAISESKKENLLEDFENLGYRINGELVRLRKSANLNLVIGTLTTIFALTALAYEVFMSDFKVTNNLVSILGHYIPRLSLIVFIEIFAFFFLKLYKATLADIKYFNNEKTNVDFKIIALKTALYESNEDLLKLSIEELVKTERNFKLQKGESTVELEKMKSDNSNNKLITELLSKITDKV